MNNNESEEEINEAINNYITYSREYLLLAHNMLAFTSRNDERLYNLLSLYVRNNQIHRHNDPIINNTFVPTPTMTNNMHRNNNSYRNNNSHRNRRTNNSTTNTRNVRHRSTYNRNNMSLPSEALHSRYNIVFTFNKNTKKAKKIEENFKAKSLKVNLNNINSINNFFKKI